jgi:hypothetical protein
MLEFQNSAKKQPPLDKKKLPQVSDVKDFTEFATDQRLLL